MLYSSRLTINSSSHASRAVLFTSPVAGRTTKSSSASHFLFPRRHVFFSVRLHSPPKKPLTDDVTGEPLIQRSDDNVDTLTKRLATYHKQTGPVVDYYRQKGLWVPIDAAQSPNVVWENLAKVFRKSNP